MFSGDRGLDSLLGLAFAGGGWVPHVVSATARLRDRRDGVFENQLLLGARFQNQREFVEALDAAQQLCTVNQIDRYRGFLAAREIEEAILNILRRWF